MALAFGFIIAWLLKPVDKVSSVDSQQEHNHEMEESVSMETEYTCSMHPQIRQNEPGICPICEMDLIPVEQNASSDPLVLTMTEAAAKLSNIQTVVIGATNFSGTTKEISLTGKVKSDETTASSLVSHVPGRIEKLYISYTGEPVKQGQKLADIYSPELINAQQELLEAKALIDVNPSLIEASKAKLRNWKLTDRMISNILESDKVQETFTFFAESAGTVSNRRVSVGDYVRKGEAMFDLIDLNKVWVVFDAYEEDLSKIRKGDRISFTTPALGARKFNTNVSFIDPIINPSTRTASIRTEINNSRGLLKPEMFVNGIHSKIAGKSGSSLLVPKSSVLWTGTRSVVYLKEQDSSVPSFRYQEIMIGERVGEYYKVLSGLEEGMEVVVNGAFTIDAAAQLNNQSSMMNKNVSLKSSLNQSTIPDFTADTPSIFKEQLAKLLDIYIQLKDAMVETNAKNGKEATSVFIDEIKKVDMTLVKGDSHMFWMEKVAAMNAHGSKIVNAGDIEDQRKQFDFLSEALIETITAFGIGDKKVYVQHCPMAFDNKGAEWLSYNEEIRNPYFGDKMMKCGITQDTLGI